MNNTLFQQAKAAVAAKRYDDALNLYTQCLQDSSEPLAPGETGLIYHQIGNVFLKLRDFEDAIQSYQYAASDTAYDACGAVNCNAGMAYIALRDYQNAVKHFEIAVSDSKYPTPYKAYLSMGNALLKLGQSAEAGVAFREAALDEANPDPTKALLNLGVCFMTLSRPSDAVTSYESALQFSTDAETSNKIYASLGQAYVEMGQMDQAVEAFERATADRTYRLSATAVVDYQRAIATLQQSSEATQALPVSSLDMSGLDVVNTPEAELDDFETQAMPVQETFDSEGYYVADVYGEESYEGSEEHFFNASDEEIEQWSRGIAQEERKKKSAGLKVLLAIIVVLVLAIAGGVFAYSQGYGYPTQDAVVKELMQDPQAAATNGIIADGVSEEARNAMIKVIPAGATVTVDGVEQAMSKSTAYATVTTPEGGSVQYQVQLVRDGIGWDVSDVSLYFASQH